LLFITQHVILYSPSDNEHITLLVKSEEKYKNIKKQHSIEAIK